MGTITEPGFASWSTPEVAWTIEYPLELMDQIRAFACTEPMRISPAGRDVGGVMYGSLRAKTIRIATWRPIGSEYAHGDILKLSNNDRMTLAVQFEAARGNQEFKDLRPVGWFVSHPQSAVAMTAADLEIYSGFFPESWQISLVLHPTEGGRADAGFFARDGGGIVRAEASYKNFVLEPAIAEPIKPQTAPAETLTVAASIPEPSAPAAPTVPVTVAPPSFTIDEPLPARDRWLWAIPIVLALGVVAWVLYATVLKPRGLKPAESSPLSFRVSASGTPAAGGGQAAQLDWDVNSRPVRDSERGEIDIVDGAKSSQVALSSDQLHAGKMTYLAQSGDVGFDLTVYPPNVSPVHEATRLVTPAISAPATASEAPVAVPPKGIDNAQQDQVRRLTEELRKERARADELQNVVRILQNRLGVQPDTPKTEPQQ